MSECPEQFRYTRSHEWVERIDDHTVRVGITSHAQEQLGDVVFVDFPELNEHFNASDEALVVESVKTAADIYSPITGELLAVNERLVDQPELVNQEPFTEGWLYEMSMEIAAEYDTLLTAEQYIESLEEE